MEKGLTQSEAARRLSDAGPNELPTQRSRRFAAAAAEVLAEPMLLLLVATGVVYLALGDLHEALTLVGAIVLVVGLTLYQERKTEKTDRPAHDASHAGSQAERNRMRRLLLRRMSTVCVFIAMAIPSSLAAQERPRAALEFTSGWVGFADDGIVSEGLVGGAARFYLLPRISVGPEVAFIQGDNHSHFVLTGNVTCDLLADRAGTPRRLNVFVVGGGGLFQTREQLFNGRFTSTEGAFTAGGGIRALVADRVTLGVETRIGWELHVRVTGLVGVQLGR